MARSQNIIQGLGQKSDKSQRDNLESRRFVGVGFDGDRRGEGGQHLLDPRRRHAEVRLRHQPPDGNVWKGESTTPVSKLSYKGQTVS